MPKLIQAWLPPYKSRLTWLRRRLHQRRATSHPELAEGSGTLNIIQPHSNPPFCFFIYPWALMLLCPCVLMFLCTFFLPFPTIPTIIIPAQAEWTTLILMEKLVGCAQHKNYLIAEYKRETERIQRR